MERRILSFRLWKCCLRWFKKRKSRRAQKRKGEGEEEEEEETTEEEKALIRARTRARLKEEEKAEEEEKTEERANVKTIVTTEFSQLRANIESLKTYPPYPLAAVIFAEARKPRARS